MEDIDEENICVDLREPSKHGFISKSHKAAELGIHVVTSIQEVLTT